MPQPIRAHFHAPPSAEQSDFLRGLLHEGVSLTVGPDLPTPADFDLLIEGRPTRERLTASPNLKHLIIPFAGLPETTRELLAEFPHLTIHNLHHNNIPTAEMALTLMLAAAKNIVPVDGIFRRHDWTPRYEPDPTVILYQKTALILGYGAVGRHIGAVCRALGMRVYGVKRTPSDEAEVYPQSALPAILSQTHILIVCLPLTPETRHLIGAMELALMPPGGVLVNVGRAEVVEEGALYAALASGHLHAAGLDVWYEYPPNWEQHKQTEPAYKNTPPAHYPFHELPNVVMSPHRAGHFGAPELETWRMEHLARLLNAAAEGQPIPNRVDLSAGY